MAPAARSGHEPTPPGNQKLLCSTRCRAAKSVRCRDPTPDGTQDGARPRHAPSPSPCLRKDTAERRTPDHSKIDDARPPQHRKVLGGFCIVKNRPRKRLGKLWG